LTGVDTSAGWRVGGAQPLAIHRASQRLFVLMHQGAKDSHKEPGMDVWVYDIGARRRNAQFTLTEPVKSILVTQGAAPRLVAVTAEGTDLHIFDDSGRLLHALPDVGQDLVLLQAYLE
ncbi:MAG: amine dehydrogenase large subunit, partial [Burkholderiales bacterium]